MSTVGADPEVFIRSREGAWIPAHWVGLPYKGVPLDTPQGKLLRDGYAVEFNPHFSICRYVLAYNFWSMLREVAKRYLKNGESLVAQSAVQIDLGTLEDAPDDVSEFGCEGAWNAYTQTVVKPEIHGPSHPFRYAGGHFHGAFAFNAEVPWTRNMEDVFLWAKIQDRYTGIISTYLTGSEWAALRRQYYGQAGEFRLQDHPNSIGGLEYRTPGSEVWSHPALLSFILGLFRHIYENFPTYKKHYSPQYEGQVRDAINAGVSHDSLLDLIPEMPGWYTRKLLKVARAFFAPIMHDDLLPLTHIYAGKSFRTLGWGEWCTENGYTHYRDDYRDDDVPVVRTKGMNNQWEMAETDATPLEKKEVA